MNNGEIDRRNNMGRTAEPDPFEIGIAPGHGRVVDGLAEVQPLLKAPTLIKQISNPLFWLVD
jgi:hypothetical protein